MAARGGDGGERSRRHLPIAGCRDRSHLPQGLSEKSQAKHAILTFSGYGARSHSTPTFDGEHEMSIGEKIDEPRSVAAEALRLAHTVPDAELASVLREIAAIFGEDAIGEIAGEPG
jgi:hypothetical protein